MRITEPMTMMTDYVMGALAFVLAMRIVGDAAAGRQLSGRLWAAALVMTAVAAFLGGTYHGFIQWMPGASGRALWKATLLATGIGSACLLAAAVTAATAGALQRALLAVVVVKLLVYVWTIATKDQFALVIADYGTALLAVALAAWFIRPSGLTPAAWWITGGVAVAVRGRGHPVGPPRAPRPLQPQRPVPCGADGLALPAVPGRVASARHAVNSAAPARERAHRRRPHDRWPREPGDERLAGQRLQERSPRAKPISRSCRRRRRCPRPRGGRCCGGCCSASSSR